MTNSKLKRKASQILNQSTFKAKAVNLYFPVALYLFCFHIWGYYNSWIFLIDAKIELQFFMFLSSLLIVNILTGIILSLALKIVTFNCLDLTYHKNLQETIQTSKGLGIFTSYQKNAILMLKYIVKIMLLAIVKGILLTLCALLFLVSAIIKGLAYSQTLFIVKDLIKKDKPSQL